MLPSTRLHRSACTTAGHRRRVPLRPGSGWRELVSAAPAAGSYNAGLTRTRVPASLGRPIHPDAAMPLFWKKYESDTTQFINELKAKKPTLEAEQRAGRGLLWDRPIDRAAEAGYRAAKVPQSPYVYFSRPKGR